MPETERSAISAALERLHELADESDRDALDALRDRLDSARLRVLVAGEAKRGKSTLVNALLGWEALPAGVTPLTAVATTVTAGNEEGIEVAFADGRSEGFPLASLADFCTERGNPGNRRHVSSISVRLDAPVLDRGVEIVDTPGTGSVHAHNTSAAQLALPSMDAAIFVLTADPPVSASERDLLSQVAGLSVALFIVLNKADYLDRHGLAEALEFTAQVVAEAVGRSERVYPVSARAALAPGGDEGFAAFAADFLSYLETGRIADLERSVAGHARRIAALMLDEVTLARRAAELPGQEAAERVTAFGARLKAMGASCDRAEDRAGGQSRRLLAALNAAAEQAQQQFPIELAASTAGALDAELASASPAEIARRGRERLTTLVAERVEKWRQEQARLLEAGLHAIDEQCAAELEAELAGVRAAAADLLGLELAMPGPGDRLGSDQRFFYVLDEHVDQSELLAGAVRRRLPGELGRRVARQHLLGQVPELVGAQVGRARGDLQYRLAEATRRLLADVRRRYADCTERLSAALDRAASIRAAAFEQGEQQLADLTAHAEALRAITGMLPKDSAGWPGRTHG